MVFIGNVQVIKTKLIKYLMSFSLRVRSTPRVNNDVITIVLIALILITLKVWTTPSSKKVKLDCNYVAN